VSVAAVVAGMIGLAAPAASAGPSPAPGPVRLSHTFAAADSPYAIGIDSKRGLVYVDNESDTTTVINEATDVTKTISATSSTDSIGIDEQSGYAYVTNDDSPGSVAVLKAGKLVGSVAVGDSPDDVTVDTLTGYAYVDNADDSTVSVLKGTHLVATIAVGNEPEGGAYNVKSGLIYIPNTDDNTVSVIKGTSVKATINVPAGPQYAATVPGTSQVYIESQDFSQAPAAGMVTLLDGTSATPVATAAVGVFPYGITVNPRTHLAYATNVFDGTVSVLKDGVVVATRTVGDNPEIPSIDPRTGIVAIPSDDGDSVAFMQGTNVIQTMQVGDNTGFSAVDPKTGRVFVSSNTDATTSVFDFQNPLPATVKVTSPIAGAVYSHSAKLTAHFSCAAGVGNTTTSCDGSVTSGASIHTNGAGEHSFTVHVHSSYGPAVTKTIHYRVAPNVAAWFHDPLSTQELRAETKVPSNPETYDGRKLRHTRATNRTHRGTVAVSAHRAAGHVLSHGEAIVLNKSSLFGFNSAVPSHGAEAEIRNLRPAFNGVKAITCEGDTDFGGSASHEKTLSVQRAKAICALVHNGHHGIHTMSVGYGGTQPVVVGGTPGSRSANRRVVIDIRRSVAKTTDVHQPKPGQATAPHLTTAAAGSDGTGVITFTAPATTHGATVTGYQVSIDGGKTWQHASIHGASPYTVTLQGLQAGKTYLVEVRAATSTGHSPASNMRTLKTALAGSTPDAPVASGGTPQYNDPGPSTADFSFTTPADNGSAITGYQVSVNGGAWTDIPTSEYTPGDPNQAAIPVDYDYVGCPNATTYTFAIRSVNAVGFGPASGTVSVTFTQSEC
jgi:outer membrane protein OmpA-like peptidoglycan-associated protein